MCSELFKVWMCACRFMVSTCSLCLFGCVVVPFILWLDLCMLYHLVMQVESSKHAFDCICMSELISDFSC